ncbi:LysR family transcriptional regulator [Pseudomonas citronellolis]|uniref:LysR family transcriptional regulator n=1 Tax=Pseudomonas citronellolis TaxID=53408 RepID=UPI0021C0A7EA|nr:LysR family transcriptional regulator [Pseudomonas citronellolis]UXJ50097.1 LysR family transcriptional regulator [Pseudomonas citronellolis]
MRIRHLRYFLAVAEELNISRAATKVHIEPSPLSRAIRELEAELGAHLFQRTQGRIRLTWAGEVFREEAQRMITLMEGARARVYSAALGYRGRLRIGLSDSLAQPRLAKLLARCREEEPQTEIKIIEMTVKEMTRALQHDLIDAGFTLHPEVIQGYVKETAWTDRPVIAIPRNHPLLSFDKVPPHELSKHALILGHPELCAGGYDITCRKFCEFTLPLPTIAEFVSGHEPMMMLVAAGYGIGIGLESQVLLYSNPEVIIRPFTDEISSAQIFITRVDKPPSEELRRFIARAKEIGTAITA